MTQFTHTRWGDVGEEAESGGAASPTVQVAPPALPFAKSWIWPGSHFKIKNHNTIVDSF